MKILSLQAENVKRISVVNIKPDGALVEITGRNRQGKTSVLDSIWWLLTGGRNIQAQPIRAGEKEAVIVGVLGDGSEKFLKVTRRFRLKKAAEGEEQDPSEFTTTLTVENEAGFKAAEPQKMLDALIGSLSFDPLAFLNMDPKKRLETLKSLVALDFTSLDEANKADFAKRTEINRDAASYRAQANAVVIPEGAPEERVNVDDLITQLDEAGQKNADRERLVYDRRQEEQSIERDRTALEAGARRLDDIRAEIDRLQAQLKTGEQELETGKAGLEKRAEDFAGLDPLPELVDTADLRQKISEARALNDGVTARERKAELAALAKKKEDEAEALTAAMDERKAQKAKALAEADMPVDGLDFGEHGVILNGQPFEQASDAEQLETSIAIAAAMNPELRVIRVRDGSLMDGDAMKRLADFAEERDLQVWVETVQSGRPGAVVIEDGHVVEAGEQGKLV